MKLKRTLTVLILVAVFAFGLCACGGPDLKDEVKPYMDYLGGSKATIKLPTDLYDDKETVSFAGREGSIEFDQSFGSYFMDEDKVDEIVWTSNDKVTHEQFEDFKKSIDKYYGFEAEEVKVFGTPAYRWEGDEVGCMVTASYDNGHAEVQFQLE